MMDPIVAKAVVVEIDPPYQEYGLSVIQHDLHAELLIAAIEGYYKRFFDVLCDQANPQVITGTIRVFHEGFKIENKKFEIYVGVD